MTELAIEAHGLVKHFGTTRAVDGIDLSVRAGTVYGVLGPNGAGKTTAVRMLATLLRPDAGTARVLGRDVVTEADAVRGLVGLTGQYASVDEDLTATENLVILARLYGFSRPAARARAADLLGAFELTEAAGRQVKTFSGGMRRRIDLAASLVMSPVVLFLDEPTTGLDPRSRNDVWDIVRVLVADGATVLLTTQYLDEADQLADRIAVIDHGAVIAEGTASELKSSVGSGTVHLRLADAAHRETAARIVAEALHDGTAAPQGVGDVAAAADIGAVSLPADPYALSARVDSSPEGRARAHTILPRLHDAGIHVPEFSLGQPSLDEVFLALTGQPSDQDAPSDPTTTPDLSKEAS